MVEADRLLQKRLEAALVLFGDGKLRSSLIEKTRDLAVLLPRYLSDRQALARALASSGINVSGMADEALGISVIEAQASGPPVAGVSSGAMIERVPPALGLLGPVDDAKAMASSIANAWREDGKFMGNAAREHASGQFSWNATFSILPGQVYAAAIRTAADRTGRNRSHFRSGHVASSAKSD